MIYLDPFSHKNKEYLKNFLDNLDPQGCMSIKGIEIIKYLYPTSILCSNSRCPKNKKMYSEATGDKEKQIFIRDECKICKKFTFDFPENVKHHIFGIPHLNEILEKRKNFTQNKNSLSFLPIDLRKEKKDGILSKSHLVDFSNFHDKIAYDLIDDFIEFKDIYHFSFFVNYNDYCFIDNKEKNKKNFNEKFFTQPDEVFG